MSKPNLLKLKGELLNVHVQSQSNMCVESGGQLFEMLCSHNREQCFKTTCSKTWQLQG
jgi:hypothetical protein